MKTVPAALRTHLDQEVTALCTCWEITRVDGTILRFTDSDEDVMQGGQLYQSIGAYRRTAIESTATLSVDNLEIVGITNDIVLPENQLQAGLFDGAEVRIFITSWQDGVRGELKMRRGFFGEVQVLQNGTYQVELRGLMQRLGYTYTDVFTPTCRVDLGSKECGIPIPEGKVKRSTAYAVGDTVIAPNSANDQNYVGNYTKMPIGDSSFELAGAATNLNNSVSWRQAGAVDMSFSTTQPQSGTYSARGGAGTSQIEQDIDLIAATGMSAALIDGGGQLDGSAQVYPTANFYGWRRDTGTTGRLRLHFYDWEYRRVGFGRAMNTNAADITPSSNITLAGDFTIEGWIFLKAGAVASQAGFGAFGTSTDGTNNTRNHGDIRFNSVRLFYNPQSSNSNQVFADTGFTPNELRWYHIAVTRRVSDGQVTIYIDGVQRGQSSGFVDPFIFERVGLTLSGRTTMVLDDFRIWNTVRTGYEINGNKDQTLVGTETGLIHYWRFNDETGAATTGAVTLNLGANVAETVPSPVAVRDGHTPNAAGAGTGLQDVGTTWVLRSFQNLAIPHGTRYARIIYDATGNGSYLDNVFGWFVDPSTRSTTGQIPSILAQNTQYVCSTAGTTAATLPTYGGATVADGTAVFTKDSNPWARNGIVTDSDGPRVFRALVTDARAVDAWFNGGLVTFETGANAGVSMEVKNWTQANGQLELFLSLPFNIEPGDLFRVYPGCDKSRISCAAIFNNILNFRGFPDVPGQDDLYRYPDART